MPQIYPQATPGLPVNVVTNSPITGGGQVGPGGTVTLGLSTSNNSIRNAYTVSPSPDGTVQNFTIVNAPTGLNVSYADVYINGYLQQASAFTLTGSTLSLNTAPSAGANVFVAFSSPTDSRQQFTLAQQNPTTFTFPTVTPQGIYADIYDGNGVFQAPSTKYNLDITNGAYSVVFASAPVTPVIAVFDPSVNSGRQAYQLTPAADGSTTSFTIINGVPSTPYIDVYKAGLFQMVGSSYAYTLNYLNGAWMVVFAAAPTSGNSLEVVFAPSTVTPQNNGQVVNYLNGESGVVNLVGGTNITITPAGQNITISNTSAVPTLISSVLSTTPTSGTYTYTSPALPVGCYRISTYFVCTAASGSSQIGVVWSYTDTYGAQTNNLSIIPSVVGGYGFGSMVFYNASASATPTLVFTKSGTGTASYIPQSIILERLG